jgi:hypothetical protein
MIGDHARQRARRFLGILLGTLAVQLCASAAPWPQFRGPTGLGFTSETNLPLSWSGKTGENVLWQSPLVGQGHASPIVWGDAVFLCTVRWPSNSLSGESVIPEHHVTCYQVADGKLFLAGLKQLHCVGKRR